MISIKNVTDYLESIAPLSFQESYDNAGLITGNAGWGVTGVVVCLDCTEEVVLDAIKNKCNLIVAHHPIIFSGLKKLTGKNYIEKCIITAIKNDISIYAIHTNLDNVYEGVNKTVSEKLGLINLKLLSPKKNTLKKIVTFCPVGSAEIVRTSLFQAGAGHVGNYDECSFNMTGEGTFRGNENAKPFAGKIGVRHTESEVRIEMIFQEAMQNNIIEALLKSHPYEEVAYDIYNIENSNPLTGAGMIGELSDNQDETEFLKFIKSSMKTECIRYTRLLGQKIHKVAVCGGAGSFLLPQAIKEGAQIFITADFKYHQFFDADGRIIIADIGHFESEQFTIDLIRSLILKKFSTFAVRITEVNTNPVNYM